MTAPQPLRIALATLVLLGGLVHIQQFIDGFRAIPVIGPMFLLNGIASAVIAALLVWRKENMWIFGAAMISAGSLAAIIISRGSGLFGYVSGSFEAPEALAVIFEGAALLLAGFVLSRGRLRRPLASVADGWPSP